MNTLHQTRQQGVILVLSLVILMAMTLIGVTAMQNVTQEERMTNNARQRNLAFQGAEAGLRAGEAAVKAAADHSPFAKEDGITSYNWEEESTKVENFTTSHDSFRLAEKPCYIVKYIGPIRDTARFRELTKKRYRITSRSVGGIADAVVILQSTYTKDISE